MSIQARCRAPAVEPDFSGSPPSLRTSSPSSLMHCARSLAHCVKNDFSSGFLTLSAASLNPFCPSRQVSIRSLSVLIALSLSTLCSLPLFVLSSEHSQSTSSVLSMSNRCGGCQTWASFEGKLATKTPRHKAALSLFVHLRDFES